MKDLEIILSLAGTVFGLLLTASTFIAKSVKDVRAKKAAEQAVKIGNAVLPFIREAEKFAAYSGAEKKAYVMTKANQFAIESHMPFDEARVSEKVEELVDLTKQVNFKEASQSGLDKEADSPMNVGNADEAKKTAMSAVRKPWVR